jgi:hypothetical protein
VRGEPAAVFRRHHLVRLGKDERGGLQRDAGRDRRFAFRDAAFRLRRRLRGHQRQRGLDHIAVSDLVENAERFGLFGGMRGALEHDLERGLRADQTRKALRSARAGE